MAKTGDFIYNIRQVIELTGISEFTLRGWETRYEAFHPHRSKTGRRLYCKTDILKIHLLSSLLDQGHKIGKVAHLNVKKLESLSIKTNFSKVPEIQHSSIPAIADTLTLAERFEWDRIQALLRKNSKSMGTQKFILNFLLPLIKEMNLLVENRQFSIAQEHIMSAMIKECLYRIVSTSTKNHKKRTRVVLATPEGDYHEIGVLMASAILADLGIRQLYLGPNVPKADLCEASLRFNATHVLLASTISTGAGAKDELFQFIHYLDRNLDPKIQILLGGRNALAHSIKLERKHLLIHSFAEIDRIFRT
jgi:DNA-binding transcriptional MerR regulator/methylmalonyl-CoA mutase cobalamin-binding subunit